MLPLCTLFALLHVSSSLASAATYRLVDNFVGKGFLSGFEHEAIDDPTHGRVVYVDEATALKQNLTYASGDTFVIRTDHKSVLDEDGPGRNSVRIRSKKTYSTHVAVFDIRHMPQGCATWPAAWETLESDWPDSGEIDIVEGVNDVSPNHVTLHTSPNCTMPTGLKMTGTQVSTDCDTNVNVNQGCSVADNKANNYGPEFNAAGGGWYVIERTDRYVRSFFWSRYDNSVPAEVKHGSSSVRPDRWGTPESYFPDTECDFDSHFGPNNIIINLTLCGDWAGNDDVYASSGCPSTCVDFVNNNPAAFVDAYWNIAAVRVYESTHYYGAVH